MTEKDIIKALFYGVPPSQKIRFWNTKIFSYFYEADFVGYTGKRSTEYEIKTSRSDFLVDKKKVSKHKFVKSGKGPNHFYYVTSDTAQIDISMIPDHAGWMKVIDINSVKYNDWGQKKNLKIVKKAPLLHSIDVLAGKEENIIYTLMYKAIKRI